MRYWKSLALVIAALLIISSSARAQVSINIGPEPVCPYGYYTTLHTAAPHMGTTGPSGSMAVCSSELDLGSTGLTTSTATLITF
jgi:hypothetical protein